MRWATEILSISSHDRNLKRSFECVQPCAKSLYIFRMWRYHHLFLVYSKCAAVCVCVWWLVTGDYDQTTRNSNCAFFYVLLSALLLPAAARQSTIIQWCELSKIKIMKKSVLCHWMLGYQPEPLSNSVCLRIKWQKNKNINKNCDYISEWIRQFQLDLTLIHRIWHSYTIYARCKH